MRGTTAVVLMTAVLASPLPVSAETEPASVLDRISSFTDRAAQVALEALSLVGIRYRYGGNSPEQGLDCSGLVRYVFREAGTDLPRTSNEMSRRGQPVDKQDLQPGDLVFFGRPGRGIQHVAIEVLNAGYARACLADADASLLTNVVVDDAGHEQFFAARDAATGMQLGFISRTGHRVGVAAANVLALFDTLVAS
jgi:cell wall-associated NlpC family hydrolase